MSEYKELSIKEIQEANFSALTELDRICRENGLTYFLTFGTLLGAVRHHGFIPWDDDVDVVMHRKDFKRLENIMNQTAGGRFKLCSRANTKNYPYYISRFCNMDYQYVTGQDEPVFDIGAFVDIYLLDNYCKDREAGIKLHKKMNRMNTKYFLYLKGTIGQNMLMRVAAEAGHIFLRLIKGKNYSQRINAEMDRVREKVTSDQDPWIGVPCWSIGFSQYERKVFEEKTELEFEGKKFFVPKQYDYLLTRWYDDYMELPPEKDRTATHHYKMYKRSN